MSALALSITNNFTTQIVINTAVKHRTENRTDQKTVEIVM